MKNKIRSYIATLTAVLMLICTTEVNASSPLDDISEMKGVDYVYIGEGMLSSVGDIGGVDIGRIASELTGLEVVSASEPSPRQAIKSYIPKLTKSLERVQDVKDSDGERVRIYAKKKKVGFSEMLMIVEDDDDIVIIRITGSINPEEIKDLVGN